MSTHRCRPIHDYCNCNTPQRLALFFLGILLAINALETGGVLSKLAVFINANISNTTTIATSVHELMQSLFFFVHRSKRAKKGVTLDLDHGEIRFYIDIQILNTYNCIKNKLSKVSHGRSSLV